MIDKIRQIFAAPVFEGDNDKTYEARILNTALWMAIVFTFFGIIVRIFVQDIFQQIAILINIVQLIIWSALLILLRRGNVRLTNTLLTLAILATINIQAYISGGLHRPIIYANVVALSLAALFSNRRVILYALISIFAVAIMYFFDGVFLPAPETPLPLFSTLIAYSLIVFFTAIVLQYAAQNLSYAISKIRADEEELKLRNRELKDYQETLQAQVEERTNELSKRTEELELANSRNQLRAKQFEAIAQVASAIASIRTLEELLPKITKLISEQFNFYHVGIFLNDASNQYATLCAANSAGGQRMLARKHQLKIGEQGIVGIVADSGKPRIALDVGEDAVFFNNPDLPETRSEMALPLMIGTKLVGVLDVQSTESGVFGQDDLQVLSILSDQVSLAIENARLFDESSKSLGEAEALYRQYLRQAWGRMPKEQRLEGFQYSALGAVPIERFDESKTERLIDQSKRPEIAVPIMLRGESIGILAVQVPEAGQVNEDQMDLIKAVAERVAISAENARLFEETTRRAERERLVTDITAKIRGTNDPDIMIQTALNELKTALGATKVQLVPHTLRQSAESETQAPPAMSQSLKNKKTSTSLEE